MHHGICVKHSFKCSCKLASGNAKITWPCPTMIFCLSQQYTQWRIKVNIICYNAESKDITIFHLTLGLQLYNYINLRQPKYCHSQGVWSSRNKYTVYIYTSTCMFNFIQSIFDQPFQLLYLWRYSLPSIADWPNSGPKHQLFYGILPANGPVQNGLEGKNGVVRSNPVSHATWWWNNIK